MTHTHDSAATPPELPLPFGWLTEADTMAPEVLYDQLMQKIEPELTTRQLPLLEQKYRGESPQDARKRADRYIAAFQAYQAALATYFAKLQHRVSAYQHRALQSTESVSQQQENGYMHDLESQMSDL